MERKIKIGTGSVRRISKELDSYHAELVTQQARIDRYIAEGRDEHDVWKQEEVLGETQVMIPDTEKRLAAARKELQGLVDSAVEKDSSLSESPDVKAAREILA